MVIPGHNLGNSQVRVNRTIGPTLVCFVMQRPMYQQQRFNSYYMVSIWYSLYLLEPHHEKTCFLSFQQPQNMARGLKFQIKEVDGLSYQSSESKGASLLLAYAKSRFSYDTAHFLTCSVLCHISEN